MRPGSGLKIYKKEFNIKRDRTQVIVVVVYYLKYYYYGLCRVYGKDFHSIQSQKVGTRWEQELAISRLSAMTWTQNKQNLL